MTMNLTYTTRNLIYTEKNKLDNFSNPFKINEKLEKKDI